MDRTIEKFQFSGSLYIWKYVDDQSHYPGWNITGDNDGCDSLIELLEIMDKSDYPSRKSIKTVPVTANQVKVANGGRYKATESLKLDYKRYGQIEWKTSETKDGLLIEFNKDKIKELKTSIQKIKKGNGDFAVSDSLDDNVLYFWWNP